MRPFVLSVLVIGTAITLSSCGSAVVRSTGPAQSPTTVVVTTTTPAPLPPEIDPAKYSGSAADTAVAEIRDLGYSVYLTDDKTKAALFTITPTGALPESLGKWLVSSILVDRSSYPTANVWVRRGVFTPEEQLDEAVSRAGLSGSVHRHYRTASAWVATTCRSLAEAGPYTTPAEVLSAQVADDPDRREIFELGIPLLCPDHRRALTDVVGGNAPSGTDTYGVGPERTR
ncbi:hypothetical protein [Actinosynnema sp. NPDC023587]|uniref:hypothetical protein n=1 Tax=Actinosynnema sp. NPDC023587 TaxID=3154695 RepID=UPI0033DB0D8E